MRFTHPCAFLVLMLLCAVPAHPSTLLPAGFQEELVVYGLSLPTAAEYAPDGRLFILEKAGRIRIFKDGVLLKRPFLTIPVDANYERGLLGIAFDPQFPANGYVYVYRTTAGASPMNQVERYTANGDTAPPASRVVLLSGIHSDAGYHNAGWLRFGPDGKLYISTGDGGLNSELAQDLMSLNGKILRINRDGTIPADNPFANRSDARGEIWCYGLRNPWRFGIHPSSGMLVIGDVGADTYEEINVGMAGANYGWPRAEGPSVNHTYTDPVYFYDHSSGGAGVVGGFFYTKSRFPGKYRNQFFFSDYVRGFIKTIRIRPGEPAVVQNFASDAGSVVHLLQDPDGSLLYVQINLGEIRRVRYVGGQNRPPVVSVQSSRRAGPLPLTVRFSSNGTRDPDGQPITYLWKFGDGTEATTPSATHTYTRPGTYYAVLTVRDSKGGTASSQSLRVSAGNEPPVVRILQPTPGKVAHPGDTVRFTGRATDPEDGSIPPQDMKWNVKLYHNEHTHPVLNGVRGTSGSFVVPPAIHGEGTLFFRIQLHATDSQGLSNSAYVDVKFVP